MVIRWQPYHKVFWLDISVNELKKDSLFLFIGLHCYYGRILIEILLDQEIEVPFLTRTYCSV